ncbi:MAG: HNH/ENDO VII family nuclease [Lachnospiraceae bacterium]|nr:HNH/ENDO VII family nuclease [Lachnospiraceae bacterium]
MEDVRFNKPAKDGEEFTDEGIYTITASNRYTKTTTQKIIYVGTNDILKAYATTGLSINEIKKAVNGGATIDEKGFITLANKEVISSKENNVSEYISLEKESINDNVETDIEEKDKTVNRKYIVKVVVAIIIGVVAVVLIIRCKRANNKTSNDEIASKNQQLSIVFFGYTLQDIEMAFNDVKYVFSLGEDGSTIVRESELYDDTFDKVIKNVLVGSGVIVVCVTVSAVTAGTAPAISMIFAVSAKTATECAVSGAVISGATTVAVNGVQTGDWDEALKEGVVAASEEFKWGAIGGAIGGGVFEAVSLKGATLNGLTPTNVNGKSTLIRDIDLDFKSELDGKTVTNLERMKKGRAAVDPLTGKPYELHHMGQEADSPLAILTHTEHMENGNNPILHNIKNKEGEGVHCLISDSVWGKQRADYWKELAEFLEK